MIKDKVLKEDLRALTPGRTVIWTLPTPQQCLSAQVMCYQLKRFEGMEFKTAVDAETCTISITRQLTNNE